MSSKCPVCNSDITKPEKHGYESDYVIFCSCARCGDFNVLDSFSRELLEILGNDNRKRAVLSHWIRSEDEKRLSTDPKKRSTLVLTKQLVEQILKNPPPNPAEQADNFVRWLGDKVPAPGEEILIEPSTHQSIMCAETPNGFALVIRHLFEAGIVTGIQYNDKPGKAHVTLSFKGWQYYEKLKRGAIDSRKAFMAMKYGDEQLDKIVEEVFKPAVKQTGFDLFKLVDRPQPAGLIDDILRVEIQTSRFLIADLTHNNLGAYWEAGYAEGLGKPVIYTCEKSKFEKDPPHFDTNHHLTIPWDEKNIEEAAAKLKATIRATLPEQAKLTDD